MLEPYDCLLAADIGGSNIRVGVVQTNQAKDPTFQAACVFATELWRHAEDTPRRDAAIERLGAMLERQITKAEKAGFSLAPLIGIGCPGLINKDGSIEKGGQNLPGNWESSRFNLPEAVRCLIPKIGPNDSIVTVHNDAVVQGLSEAPWMQIYEHWGVLTIGTGLGNARFTNRSPQSKRTHPEKPASAAKGKK